MGACDLSKPDFPALLERAESKYAAWYLKELRPELDRRLNELKKQKLTSGGRAIYAFQIYRELLERAVRQRLDFYSAVARESSNSGMLAKPRLDEFRQLIMTSVGHQTATLKDHIIMNNRAAGDIPDTALPNENYYAHLESEILDVVNAELRVLEAEGSTAGILSDLPRQKESDDILPTGGNPHQGIVEASMSDLAALPPKFQNAFEAKRAIAELEYVNRAEAFPRHPQFAESGLQPLIRIQTVFFAFCTEARNACREGDWTVAQVSQSVDTAWSPICDSYFVREHGEHGACSEQEKVRFRVALWRTVTDDPRWKQHLSELAGLADAATTVSPATRAAAGRFGENPAQRLAEGATRMDRPSRHEIERFANDAFAISRDRILTEYAEKRNQVLGQVRLTGNSGGYLPALIGWGADRVRKMVLALADAYVEAFKLHGVPSDERAEKDLQTAAQQIAAGTISAIRGELDLTNTRTRKHQDHPGGHLNREIEAAMKSALNEGVLGLRRQRIESKHPENPLQHPPPSKEVDAESRRPTPPQHPVQEHPVREPNPVSGNPHQGIVEGAMGDFLSELFDQFDQQEQARIRAAEASTTEMLAQGTAAAKGRRRVAESLHDNYWLLQPENDARIDSAGVVFVAYVNALWRKTDRARAECIDDFLAKVEKLIEPILTIYGHLGKGLIEKLSEECHRNAWQVRSMLRTSPPSATSSTEDSAASSSQDGAGHAGRRSEATDANEQSETETGQSPDANRPVVSARHMPILEFSDPWRKRVRQNADKNAWYARQLGRNPLEAGRQEDLLEDARAWAKAALRKLVQEVQDLRELKEQVVKQTEEFIQRHRYYTDFQLGYLQFGSALWEEGWPSLEDCALEAVIECADSADSQAGFVVTGSPAEARGEDRARLAAISVQGIAKGAMAIDSAFWRDLEARFRELPDPTGDLSAINCDGGHWELVGGSNQDSKRERLHGRFRSLARSAAIAAGARTRANALDWWLSSLVERETPLYIRHIVWKSAEYCIELATRAFELETTAADDGTPTGLGRDRYPFGGRLYDHPHQPLAEPKAELDYWKAYVWHEHNVWIDNYVRQGMASWVNRHEKLNSAIGGLSYDLAVLQANYVIDRGFRGDEALRAFRDEAAELLEEVTSSWRASCERLAVSFEDDGEEVKDLAQPFHRVRDDLRRLLAQLPPADVKSEGPPVKQTSDGENRRAADDSPSGQASDGGPQALGEPGLSDKLGAAAMIQVPVLPGDRPEGSIGPPPRRKRGRPKEIPDELKQKALGVQGGKARAQILYQNRYPSTQQVKNVSSILRHFKQTRRKSE